MPPPTMRVFRLFVLMAVITAFALPISAQKDTPTVALDETYITDDGSFTFNYPSGMDVSVSDTGTIDLDLGGTAITLLLEPVYGAAFDIDTSSLDDAMDTFVDQVTFLDFDRPTTVTLGSGAEVIRANFTADSQQGIDESFVLAVDVGGQIVFILAASDDANELEALTYAIADTLAFLQAPDDDKGSLTSDDLPTLRDHDGGMSGRFWEDSIEELIDLELIADDGELLLTGEIFNTSMNPPVDTPQDTESSLPNVAMGALMSFRPAEDADDPLCGFVTRVIETRNGYEELLFVGVDGENNLVVLEVDDENPNGRFQREDSGVDWYSPNHISFVLRENRVIVFVNGEPAWDTEVELSEPDRRGEVDDHLTGTNLEFSCVMTGAWGYAFE